MNNKNQYTGSKPLSEIDIHEVITYFGVTELLDNIGMIAIKKYLATYQQDGLAGEVRAAPRREHL